MMNKTKQQQEHRARPQEFGGQTVRSTESNVELAHIEPGFAEIEDALSPDQPHIETQSEARSRTVREIVASLSSFEQRCYELAYGSALMSSREIAHELDDSVSYKTVQRALDRVKTAVESAFQTGDSSETGS